MPIRPARRITDTSPKNFGMFARAVGMSGDLIHFELGIPMLGLRGASVWSNRLSCGVGGLETGLSLLSGLLSGPHAVWAALSTSGIKGLNLPARHSKLIIAPDGDSAGHDAASKLARTANARGWQVSLMPAPDGQDWNDVLHSGVAA